MSGTKVNMEAAQAEFIRWADIFEIDTVTDDLKEAELADFEAFRARFVKRVCSGSLMVDEEGTAHFTPRGDAGEAIRFTEPTGAVLSARQPKDTDIQGVRRVMSSWTGEPVSRFATMKLADFNFCAGLLGFFGAS